VASKNHRPRVEGRVPPYSQEAETAVIGSILLNNDCLNQVLSSLSTEDFYAEANRRIYEAIKELHGTGSPIDHVTLGQYLSDKGDLEKIGGAVSLARITDAVATMANVEYYARIVREKASLRALIYTAQEIAAKGLGGSFESTEDFIAESRSSIIEVAAQSVMEDGGPTHIAQGIKNIFCRAEKGETAVEYLNFGFGGLRVRKKIPTIIGGRPSNLKSMIALNASINMGRQKHRGLVFNLEDEEDTLWARALASASMVDLGKIEDNKMAAEDWPRLIEGANQLSTLPIWCYDKTRVSSEWIYHKAAVHKERHGLDWIIVDYLQLMRDKGADRYDRFSNSVEGLTEVARVLGVAMIIISQIKRPKNLSPGVVPNPPTEEELKETGALEQAGKTIYLSHYPSHYDKEGTNPNCDPTRVRIETAKQSNGPCGVRWCSCDPRRMWVGDKAVADY